jgi:hypothetical protein
VQAKNNFFYFPEIFDKCTNYGGFPGSGITFEQKKRIWFGINCKRQQVAVSAMSCFIFAEKPNSSIVAYKTYQQL